VIGDEAGINPNNSNREWTRLRRAYGAAGDEWTRTADPAADERRFYVDRRHHLERCLACEADRSRHPRFFVLPHRAWMEIGAHPDSCLPTTASSGAWRNVTPHDADCCRPRKRGNAPQMSQLRALSAFTAPGPHLRLSALMCGCFVPSVTTLVSDKGRWHRYRESPGTPRESLLR
jgi:hypothetical protein